MLQVETIMSVSSAHRVAIRRRRTHILVIEDDPRMQKVLQRMFHEQGYTVRYAVTGKPGWMPSIR